MHDDSQEQIDGLSPKGQDKAKRILKIVLLVAVLIAAWGIWSRYSRSESVQKWTDRQAIPVVKVLHPTIGSGTPTLTLPGNLQPFFEAPILARVNGYVLDWYHDIGAVVKQGDLLAVIDAPDVDSQYEQAKSDLMVAKANESLADITARRWVELLKTDSVSAQERDVKVADLEAKKAVVAAAQANVNRLEAFETFKKITAPFDGVVTARKTDIGALIDAGRGMELFSVAQVDPLRLYIPVPQYYANQVSVGMNAILEVPEHPNQKFSAVIIRLSGAISGGAGTLLAELIVDNKQRLLTPGDYALATFALPQNKHSFRVPATAVLMRDKGLKVALYVNGRVKIIPIGVGDDYGTEIEAITGLNADDLIIDSPQDSIEDGQVVSLAPNAGVNVNSKKPDDES
jgi:RND family efflux transporter MFP subunit